MSNSKKNKVMRGKQISVFVDNQPGTLAAVSEVLGEGGINIYALTLTGGIEHGYVRVVVDQHEEAVKILQKADYLLFERDVILLEVSNVPGALATVLRAWATAGISVDYAYCAGGPGVEQGLVVLMVDDVEQALQ